MSAHNTVAVFVPHAGCPHRCSFCDQRGITGSDHACSPQAINKLLTKAQTQLHDQGKTAQIAFFGGSFTAIERDYMLLLLKLASGYLGETFTSVRISTRPDAIDSEILALLWKYGVRDIELGAQSMDNRVLAANNRGHKADATRRAAKLIKQAGFGLGLQMMTGLWAADIQSDILTAEQIARLGPDGVRIYPTIVLRGTYMEELFIAGKYRPQTLDEAVALGAELLCLFKERSIPVIKLGLHDIQPLRQSIVAGPHHPAFRELCENRVYLREAITQIGLQRLGRGAVELLVRPDCVSKMAGQNRTNLDELARLGYPAKIVPNDSLGYLQLTVQSRQSR